MAYTNSSLVKYTSLSPNHSGQRTHSIDRITPHCVVGQLTAEGICACFPKGREASCNYGIGKDGKVALCVEEKNRSWCSSSAENDQRAVTIECASDSTAPYAFNTAVYNALIELCVDICKRNGKNKLLWLGDKTKTLNYAPKSGEMVLTVHRWFANKSCPGDWMYSRMGDLATTVTKRLSGVSGGGSTTTTPTGKTLYRVRKSWSDAKSQIGAFSVLANAKSLVDKNPSYKVFDESGKVVYEKGSTSTAFKPYTVRVTATDLYIRKEAGTNYSANGFIKPGVYTIVAESSGQGATKWGKLKSGAGWISLDYAKKL